MAENKREAENLRSAFGHVPVAALRAPMPISVSIKACLPRDTEQRRPTRRSR